MVCGREPTAQRGHVASRHPVGDREGVVLRLGDVDPFGERPRRGAFEPQRDPVGTGVAVAGSARPADATAEIERDDHLITDRELVDPVADRDHLPGRLVAEDEAGGHPVVGPLPVALPGVPVGPTDPTGVDTHDRAVWLRFRLRHVGDRQRLAVLAKNGCLHTTRVVSAWHVVRGRCRSWGPGVVYTPVGHWLHAPRV